MNIKDLPSQGEDRSPVLALTKQVKTKKHVKTLFWRTDCLFLSFSSMQTNYTRNNLYKNKRKTIYLMRTNLCHSSVFIHGYKHFIKHGFHVITEHTIHNEVFQRRYWSLNRKQPLQNYSQHQACRMVSRMASKFIKKLFYGWQFLEELLMTEMDISANVRFTFSCIF